MAKIPDKDVADLWKSITQDFYNTFGNNDTLEAIEQRARSLKGLFVTTPILFRHGKYVVRDVSHSVG